MTAPVSVSRRPDGTLDIGGVSLAEIARDTRIGTPAYVYDLDAIAAEARELREAFGAAPHLIAYAVKANSAGPIVRALVAEGCGADVVSGAELRLAERCGVDLDRIVFSGVAKTDDEIDLAIRVGARGIGAIQVESVEEIGRVGARAAAAGRRARVSMRINPGVAADEIDTHSYIATGHDEAKFGVPNASVPEALQRLEQTSSVELVGLTSHVGSQFTSTDAYLASARSLFELARQVRATFPLRFVDSGGGFGIDYGEGCAVRPADFVRQTRALQAELGLDDLALYVEPGRSLVGAHGVLVARVLQRKLAGERRWTMIDAGMNDLMRPALYQARHRIVPLELAAGGAPSRAYRVVGPVCESSDDFGVHELPDGDMREVAILDAGAYGYTMASQYNGRPLPAEVFVRRGRIVGISPRRSIDPWIDERASAGASSS